MIDELLSILAMILHQQEINIDEYELTQLVNS